MFKNKKIEWDLVIAKIGFIGGLLTIFLWALAKSIGLINTPIWVEMVPLFGGVATVLSAAIAFGRYLGRFSILEKDMHNVKRLSYKLDKQVVCLNYKFDNLYCQK